MCMGILTYVSDTSMRISHEPMPLIREFVWYFFRAIFTEKISDFMIGFFWIMSCFIIGYLVWHETIRSTDTDETFFLFILVGCSSRYIEILLRLPVSWAGFRIITDSTRAAMVSKKSRHISDESMNIFMKYTVSLSGIRTAEVDNMKMLKSIGTEDHLLGINPVLASPYLVI